MVKVQSNTFTPAEAFLITDDRIGVNVWESQFSDYMMVQKPTADDISPEYDAETSKQANGLDNGKLMAL